MKYPTQWPQCYTATIDEWKHALASKKYKTIIPDCLRVMVNKKRTELNSFVVMANHVHILFQPLQDVTPSPVPATFTSFTSIEIIKQLNFDNPGIPETLKVNKYDRNYQVWKRRSLSIELFTEKVFRQKLEYIHENPLRVGLVKYPEEYQFSQVF